jgi:hypothetical protein
MVSLRIWTKSSFLDKIELIIAKEEIMQTIRIDINDNKMDIFLNIIKNLKEDVVKSYSISTDMYYDERQARLSKLRQDMKSGKEPMYDFDTSMDELIGELKA